MSGEQLYSVDFSGELLEGSRAEQVRAALVARFKMTPAQIDRLFCGQPVTVRRDLPLPQAQGLSDAFGKAGARCRIRPQKGAPATAAAVPVAAVSGTAAAAAAKPIATPVAESAALPTDNLDVAFARRLSPPDPSRRARLLGWLRLLAPLSVLIAYAGVLLGLVVFALAGLLRPLLQSRGLFTAVVIDLVPALLAIAALVCLLRPLLIRREPAPAVALEPEQAPRLHLLAAHLADQLGAPAVDGIVLDDSLRVRAHWQGRRRLTLRVGLPLLAALDARQIAGLLASAVAATSPVHSPRLTQAIEAAVERLSRAASTPPALALRWDAWIESRALKPAIAASLRSLLAAPQRLFALLAAACSRLARPLFRQRELATLPAAAEVSGGESAAGAIRQRRLLRHAAEELTQELRGGEQDLLCEDLPGLIVWLAAEREPHWRAQIEAELADSDRGSDGLADSNRIAVAEAAGDGSFGSQAAGKALLVDYPAAARQLSLECYRALGLNAEPEALATVLQAQTALLAQQRAEAALEEYFRRFWLRGQVIVPAGLAEARALDPALRKTRLAEAVTQVRQIVPELTRLADEYEEQAGALFTAEIAAAAARHHPDPAAVEELRAQQASFAKLEAERRRCAERVSARLGLALAEAVTQARDKTKLAVEVKIAAAALAGLAALAPELRMALRDAAALGRLTELRGRGVRLSEHVLMTQATAAWHRLERVYAQLGKISLGKGSLLDRVRVSLPPLPQNAGVVQMLGHLNALDALLERARRRLGGRLAELAGAAEAAHGIRIKLLG